MAVRKRVRRELLRGRGVRQRLRRGDLERHQLADGGPAQRRVRSLATVSCSGAAACTAAGGVRSSEGVVPLILRWNGSSFTQQQAAQSGSGRVRAVSCPGTASCTAVGLFPADQGWLLHRR